MKTFAPINIVVHYPKTEDGWRELKHRMVHRVRGKLQ